jgi:hypothetical protein
LPDARKLADTIEVRIFRLGPLSGDRELELIGRRAAYLVELAVPGAGDTGFRLCGLILRCANRRIFFFGVPTCASGGGGEVGGGGGGNCADADTIAMAMPRTATAVQKREDLAMIYSSGKSALDDAIENGPALLRFVACPEVRTEMYCICLSYYRGAWVRLFHCPCATVSLPRRDPFHTTIPVMWPHHHRPSIRS